MKQRAAIEHARPVGVPPERFTGLALLVALHGLAHLAGTTDVFAKASDGDPVDVLAGWWTVSDPAALRALGVLWAILAAAFVLTAAAVRARTRRWPRLLGAVSVASLVLSAIALWSSAIGVVIDLGLIGIAVRAGALRRTPSS